MDIIIRHGKDCSGCCPWLTTSCYSTGQSQAEDLFFEEDFREYIRLMSEWCSRWKVEVWAYCLMPNHIHIIAVPQTEEGLRQAIGEAHRRYTRLINFREGWRGHLWQGRFASYPMEEQYLLAAARYVELNPVRAGLVEHPEIYKWSSAASHVSGKDDNLVKVKPLFEIVRDWKEFLSCAILEEEIERFRHHEKTGRPLGSEDFIRKLEDILGRIFQRQKPGRKRILHGK